MVDTNTRHSTTEQPYWARASVESALTELTILNELMRTVPMTQAPNLAIVTSIAKGK